MLKKKCLNYFFSSHGYHRWWSSEMFWHADYQYTAITTTTNYHCSALSITFLCCPRCWKLLVASGEKSHPNTVGVCDKMTLLRVILRYDLSKVDMSYL
jgi:hypothetical protein